MKKTYCYTALAFSIGLCFTAAHAAVVPNAGQLLQQQEQKITPAPTAVEVVDNQMQVSAQDSDVQIAITKIVIEGGSRFSQQQLHALVADAEGQSLSLSALNQVAQRITQLYQSQGYLYSRAYLPQQTLSNGVVTIAILEAQYDQSQINNQSRTRDWLLAATLEPLQIGTQVNNQQIENQLKLMNSLSGVRTRNVLAPGSVPGSSKLIVDVYNTPIATGFIGADNYGSKYTGEARLTAGAALHNLLGLGDELSIDAMSTGSKLNYGRFGYALTVNGMGTRIGASYSYLDYKLGKELKVLDAKGSAAQSSVWVSQPVLLSNTSEVRLSLQYDYKQLKDDVGLNQYYKQRDIDLISFRLDGSSIDALWGGGFNQYGTSTRLGRVKFKNADAALLDDLTAKTSGDFYDIGLNYSRLQNIGSAGTQAYFMIYGQYSPYNLDSSEQYLSGGPFNVRGYDSSQFAGSSGYYTTLELRQRLFSNAKNQVGAKVFIDTADVTINADRWLGTTGSNKAQIHSAGLGFNWFNTANFQATAEVGFPIGSKPSQMEQRDSSQYWLSLRQSF